MLKKSLCKRVLWGALDLFLIFFVLPFGFVMIYYFHLFFTGKNRPGLLVDLLTFSANISWISCAFLFLIAIILRTMIKRNKRWYAMLALALAGGGLWLMLLNLFVETSFTFWRSLLPLSLCCVVATGYALGKALYNKDSWNFSDQPQRDYHDADPESESKPEPEPELEDGASTSVPRSQAGLH